MDNSHLSDTGLLKRIKEGDHSAFEILFRRYFSRLNSYALKYIQDELLAKDMVQEVFIRFWEKRDSIRLYSLEHLLFRMVRNRCFNYLRDQRVAENRKLKFIHERQKDELLKISVSGDIPLTIFEEEVERELDALLRKLPAKCREVFLLSRKEGLSNAEIAERMSFSVKNVEKYITQALKVFRSHFDNQSPV